MTHTETFRKDSRGDENMDSFFNVPKRVNRFGSQTFCGSSCHKNVYII